MDRREDASWPAEHPWPWVAPRLCVLGALCALFCPVQSWRFFNQRVAYEEWTLRRFFGAQYEAYAAHTPSGLPFIQ